MLRPELAVNIMSYAGMTVCGSALETGLFHFVNSSLLLVEMRAQPAVICELAGVVRGTCEALKLPQLPKILYGTAA